MPESHLRRSLLCSLSPSRVITAIAVLSLAASAHAASILSDGGFESATGGDIYFAGQSLDGGSWKVTLGDVYIDTLDPYVYAGNNSLNLTYVNPYTADSVSQVLSTIAGDTYAVNFWANSDTPNVFSLTENGVAVSGTPTSIVDNGFPGAITNSSLFVDYSGIFTASSTSTTLAFTGTGNPPIGSSVGSVMIDNVSVQLAPTPEPSSIVLTLTGVIGVGIGLVRRRLARSPVAV